MLIKRNVKMQVESKADEIFRGSSNGSAISLPNTVKPYPNAGLSQY